MSECPNCGSPESEYVSGWKVYWQCESGTTEEGHDYVSEACVLIRSLREELAATKKSLHGCRLLHGDARDAERDQIADWLDGFISKYHSLGYLGEASGCEEVQAALRNNEHRNNEHRSNT